MKTPSRLLLVALTLAAVGLGSSPLFATSRQRTHGQLAAADYAFACQAAQGGMMEVQAGGLAKQKASAEVVRNFGERMVTDHSKANERLRQIAAQKGAVLPTVLSAHERVTINRMKQLSGAAFDKAYANDMVEDHEKDVKEFKAAAAKLSDPDLRAFAAATTPTLEEHLTMARQMAAQVKSEK